MRPHFFFILLYVATMGLVAYVAAGDQGPHDGIVKKAGPYYIEMKTGEKKLFAYLLNRKLKTLGNAGIHGEVDLVFTDNTTQNIPLLAEKDSAFTCSVPADFTSCKVTFTITGKTVSARFSNPVKIVQK